MKGIFNVTENTLLQFAGMNYSVCYLLFFLENKTWRTLTTSLPSQGDFVLQYVPK